MITREQAAEARSKSVRQPDDRPRERRAGELSGRGVTPALGGRIQLREAPDEGAGLTFEGYASVVGTGYDMFDAFGPYTEVVRAGAFTETLAQEDLDVPLVLGHDPMRRLARTTNGTLALDQDKTGLHVLAADLDPDNPEVAYITPMLRSGLIDEMSFAFRITAGEWSPDWSQYDITAVDIQRGDVSIVGYGANPNTIAALREAVGKLKRGQALNDADMMSLGELVDILQRVDPDKLAAAFKESGNVSALRGLENAFRRLTMGDSATPRMSLQDLLAI